MKTKYGIAPYSGLDPIYGPEMGVYTSNVFSLKSGRYCVYGTSSAGMLACADNAAAISGFTQWTGTASATTLATKISVAYNIDQFATEMPYAASGAAATLTAAVLITIYSKLIDIFVSSNIQYADNAASQSVLRVVGGDVAENTLYVHVVDSKMNQAAL